jgi:hypothetical protein
MRSKARKARIKTPHRMLFPIYVIYSIQAIFRNWYIYARLCVTYFSSKIRNWYKYMFPTADEATSLISLDGKSITLSYKKNETPYQITLPYSFSNSLSMYPLSATLFYNGSNLFRARHEDITQQPGIPYVASANDYGAESITFVNKDTGATKVYKNDERPGYITDLYMDE